MLATEWLDCDRGHGNIVFVFSHARCAAPRRGPPHGRELHQAAGALAKAVTGHDDLSEAYPKPPAFAAPSSDDDVLAT